MQEQLININTAILAKMKGFKIPTWDYFSSHDGNGNLNLIEACNTSRLNFNNWEYAYLYHKEEKLYSRPTQSLLQKWLREKYSLFIMIDPIEISAADRGGYRFYWSNLDLLSDNFTKFDDLKNPLGFLTYEDALENALLTVLTYIK